MTILVLDEERDFCVRCKVEIVYHSPENFDPVCIDEDTGDVHCEECCTCSDEIEGA